MASSNLKLSDTSYTNKEFQELYPELLEKAKELSYKWDPTVSNESDPGVTLIKEIAIAIDKINYASDKNALETMPLSVTQERTARQLFQLLGYYPKWYISAEADVSMAWKIDSDSEEYESLINSDERVKIPAFTEIKDDSGDYVYTIPTTTILKATGDVETVKAIQGVVKDLKINNTTNITLDLIDQNNRVYFPDYNVAQNGIFIMNKDAASSDNVNERTFWEQKDNLYVEEPGNRFYSFNIDIPTNRCYVEFPADIADLISGGLNIKYLVTSGRDGNSAVGQLNQLYDSQVTATYVMQTDRTLTMDSDNLYIQNTNLKVTGKDPESIDDMYRNYNRIKGTFDTIVTLRDYNNAVYNTGAVSNAVVTDRTNDVQQAYRMMASTIDGSENVVYMPQSGDYKMHAFALKIYALQYDDLVDTGSESENKKAYDTTFEMFEDLDVENPFNIDSSLLQLTYLLNDERCIQHDFSNILKNKICLLKNVAEISLMVFPNVQLTDLQKRDVIDSIKNMIYLKYNARKRNFGEEIDYDTLFTDILTSNVLIKNISLNQIQYYTYALYYSEGDDDTEDGWKQVCVSDEYDYLDCIVDYETGTATIKNSNNVDVRTKGKNVYFLDQQNYVWVVDQNNDFVKYSTKRSEFRVEIFAKNVLAGITPLYMLDEDGFSYAIDETNTEYPAVESIDIYTRMDFDTTGNVAIYYPRDNEVIQFVRPQLTNSINYGTYVKYDYVGQNVGPNQNHKMISGESLVIYYKTEDSEDAPYTKVCYGDADSVSHFYPIISPTFQLSSTTDVVRFVSDPRMLPTSVVTCRSGQSINIKEKNEVKLDKNNYIYVVGDEVEYDDVKKYRIEFQKEKVQNGIAYYSTTLQGDQQVVYAKDSLAYLNIVGSGTKITIEMDSAEAASVGSKFVIENTVVSLRNISRFGVQALKGYWKKLPYQVTVLAQEFINVQGTLPKNEPDDSDRNVESYVKIESNSGAISPMYLDRDGLHYTSDGSQVSIRGVNGTVTYLDQDNISQIRDISTDQINQDQLFSFMNSEYHSDGEESTYSDQITFSPQNYIQTQIDVYIDGVKTTVSGIRTDGWTNASDKYYYIINGARLYLVKDLEEGPAVASIKGYTKTPGTGKSIIKENGMYKVSGQLNPGQAAIVGDSTNSQPFGKNFIDVVQYNDGQEAQSSIEFPLNEEPTSSTKCYIVDDFYQISSIEFDYNSQREGANTVYKDLDESNGTFSTTPQSYNVILICKQIATGKTITVPLRKTISQFVYTYSNTPETCTRDWGYTNASGRRSLISSSDLQGFYNFYSDVDEYNQWDWPLDGAEIQLNASQDYLGTPGSSEYSDRVSPGNYTFKYRNRGGEEETIVLDDETDIGWNMYGLAYVDSNNTSPQRIYDGQILTLYENSGSTEINSASDRDFYMYSQDDLYAEGYKKQNIQGVDENGDIYNQRILISMVKPSDTYSKDQYNDKEIKITQPLSKTFSYGQVPNNSYIFKITNYYQLQEFSLSSNRNLIWLNKSEKQTGSTFDLKDKGVYYFKLDLENTSSSTFKITLNIAGEKVQVLISPMKPIKTPDDSPLQNSQFLSFVEEAVHDYATYQINPRPSDEQFKNVVFFVHDDLDPADPEYYNGKDMFNYLYEPSEDRRILNPLKSTSFNNINHFYNQFTICKIITYDALGDSNIFISQ